MNVDRTIALWSAGATVAAAVLSALTTVVAVLVYLEARGIRRIEWSVSATQTWQRFNELILTGDNHIRWGRIIGGTLPWSDMEQRDRMLVYCFLNVLLFEHNARGHGLLSVGYADTSIGHNLRLLQYVWPELLVHLKSDGWPTDFLDMADGLIPAAPSGTSEPPPPQEPLARPADRGEIDGALPDGVNRGENA